jgi:uncharacterized protein (DUF1697 family)
MSRYIAFLRAINAGDHTVKMGCCANSSKRHKGVM